MPLDLEAFQNAIVKTEPPTDPDEKWPVAGYIIRTAQYQADELSDYVMLKLDGNGEVGVDYVLRPGDEPGMPFAEEMYREVGRGLLVIAPAPTAQPKG